MQSVPYELVISTARADALFASPLQPSEEPSAGQIRQAIVAAVRGLGLRGCAGRVAQAFGDHPETAVQRMRWAREAVAQAFGGTDRAPAPAPSAPLVHSSPIGRAA